MELLSLFKARLGIDIASLQPHSVVCKHTSDEASLDPKGHYQEGGVAYAYRMRRN